MGMACKLGNRGKDDFKNAGGRGFWACMAFRSLNGGIANPPGGGIPAHKESRVSQEERGFPVFFCVFLQNPLTKQPSRVMNSETTTDWRAVMQKSTLPQGVRKLKAWAEKGALAFDLPIQRASGQWSLLQKSLLIHSMLA